MSGEATETLHHIRRLNGGKGPRAGGVCFLGDSEFTFWHRLQEDMAPFSADCFNAGFGGSRCVDVGVHLRRLCLDWEPSVVIVHVGGNDFDMEPNLLASEMPARLLALFEDIAAHPSVERIGYLLSSRRPCYDDVKWAFMLQVHKLTLAAIDASPLRESIAVLDLRTMIHPLDEFVASDRQHLNQRGHLRKAQELLPILDSAWDDMPPCNWPARGGPAQGKPAHGQRDDANSPDLELCLQHDGEGAE